MVVRSVAIGVALLLAFVTSNAECQRAIPVGIIRTAPLAPEPAAIGELRAMRFTSLRDARASERGGAWGAAIGAMLVGTTGLLMGLSHCDATGSHRRCITTGAVGGVIVGAVIGYGVGRLVGNSGS